MLEKDGRESAQLLLLKDINEAANRGEPLDDVLQIAVEGVAKIFGYAACDVFLFEDENTLRYTALAVDSKITKAVEKLVNVTIIGYKIPLFEGSCFKEVIDTKSPIVLEDLVKVFKDFFAPDDKKRKFAPALAKICRFKKALRVPLVSNDEVIGVLGVATNEDVSDEDLHVLLLFAPHLAGVVERKRTEEALRKSEARGRAILDAIPDLMFRLNRDGVFLDYESAEGMVLFVPPEKFVGKKIDEVMPTDMAQKALYFIDQALETGESQFFEYRLPIQRSMYDYEARLVVSGKDEVLCIVRDITERKRAEEEMKRRLMKYSLDEGKLYLVKEHAPILSVEAFEDLLKVGYHGYVVSRTPEKEFRKMVDGDYEFLWLSERDREKGYTSSLVEIELTLENLPRESAILIQRLDYLVFKNGFDETLSFFQRLRDLAYLECHVVIITIDPKTLNNRELTYLDKEACDIKTLYMGGLPEDLMEILRFIYSQNGLGVKPSYADVGRNLEISKPTVLKRMRRLKSAGYVMESVKGNKKSMEISEKGRRLFLK